MFWILPTVKLILRWLANCCAQTRKACCSAPQMRSFDTPVIRFSTSPVMRPADLDFAALIAELPAVGAMLTPTKTIVSRIAASASTRL